MRSKLFFGTLFGNCLINAEAEKQKSRQNPKPSIMKRSVLFLLTMFLMVFNVEANSGENTNEVFGVEYRYDDAVTFYERGIRFDVFLNGDFDFDSRFLRNRRNRRVRISRDFNGRINRVGNVWIRYDFQGNVRRIGRVTMSYRRGLLRRVGNLRISYNSWGNPRFFGNVGFDDFYTDFYYGNSWNVNFNWNVGAICVYNDPFFYGNEFRNSYRRVREDANYIYYRANDGANVSRDRMIRRRKSTSNNVSTGQTVRNGRRGNTQTGTTQRRSVQNEPTNNRRRSEFSTNNNRKRRSVQNEANNNRRKTEFNTNNNRKKREVRNSSTNRKLEQNRKVQTKRKVRTERQIETKRK